MQLYIDSAGSSYTYNASGRIDTKASSDGQTMKYVYNGPNVSSVTVSKGATQLEQTTYEYAPITHNLTKATTSSGIILS